MGFEPTTSTLARSHSTTELHPHILLWSLVLESNQFQIAYETIASPSRSPAMNSINGLGGFPDPGISSSYPDWTTSLRCPPEGRGTPYVKDIVAFSLVKLPGDTRGTRASLELATPLYLVAWPRNRTRLILGYEPSRIAKPPARSEPFLSFPKHKLYYTHLILKCQ